MGDHKILNIIIEESKSFNMRSQKIEQHKRNLKLNSVQREILVGKILGDAHLETQNNGRTYRLKIEHSIIQTKYVDWLYENFKDWVLTPPQIKLKIVNGRTSKNIWFQTVSHPALRFYAQQFYLNSKKKIPKMIKKFLSPRTLAIWFMDDGSIKSKEHRALILNTQCFDKKDLSLLQKGLKTSHNIETRHRYEYGIQLLIPEPSATRFARIIEPYLLSEFRYKLGKIGLTLLPKE